MRMPKNFSRMSFSMMHSTTVRISPLPIPPLLFSQMMLHPSLQLRNPGLRDPSRRSQATPARSRARNLLSTIASTVTVLTRLQKRLLLSLDQSRSRSIFLFPFLPVLLTSLSLLPASLYATLTSKERAVLPSEYDGEPVETSKAAPFNFHNWGETVENVVRYCYFV